MSSAKLKMAARKSLAGNYIIVIPSLLLFVLIGWDCLLIAGLIKSLWLAPILTIVVCSTLIMGFIGIILKVARKKKVNFVDLFDKTDLFVKFIGLTVILFLVGLLAWVLEYLAFKSLIVIMLYQAELNTLLAAVLIIFGILLVTAILLVSIYIAISFSQAYFILYDEPNLKITKVLGKSFDMMENYILEYFVLIISFLGWIILGLFTFCLLYIWLIPYMLVTLAKFYDIVKKDYNETSGDLEVLEASGEVLKVKPVKVTAKASTRKTTTKSTTRKTSTKTTTAKKTATTRKKATKTASTTKRSTTKTEK